ncbi:DEKNAAC102374 [Brettanomyces naardenensis]|uniref:DEKNAAC102374 n=1 Tax=Brettanomyces naardenensis TaxID=13370 RepID=A0A448YK87_BRENA|nr:DEKNAAC102374 [Brettanomyces naardenensis]
MSESSYLAHTHGRRHQMNLMKRAEADKKKQAIQEERTLGISDIPKKKFTKIGRPAYKVSKIRDLVTLQKGLVLHLQYQKINSDVKPRYRLMSPFEQTVEEPDPKFQYLVVSGEPYENVAFKIPSDPIDMANGRIWDFWDPDTKEYFVQFFYLRLTN